LGKNPWKDIPGFLVLGMNDFHIQLEPGAVYHLYSRAIGNEKLFRFGKNYMFFLERFSKYILPIADVWGYVLVPNLFHLIVEIKAEPEIQKHFQFKHKEDEYLPANNPRFIMQCFSNFLNSYSKSFNKYFKRKGSLFIDYFKRVKLNSPADICAALTYVHKTPVRLGYCTSIEDWEWSSYAYILKNLPGIVCADKVIECFGSTGSFRLNHTETVIAQMAEVE
jgi:putative transposase